MRRFKFQSISIIMLIGWATVLLFSCKAKNMHLSEKYFPTTHPNSDILVGPGECLLKTFQATSVRDKFYINWIFISNTNNFIFQLESSEDGRHFRTFLIKQGAFSPNNNTELMLCAIDSTNKYDKKYFRLKAIPQNYNLSKDYLKGYASMIEATTILIARNKKNIEYDLSSSPNLISDIKFVDLKK